MNSDLPTDVRVSAPGKTILIGEHSAVYERPALLAAIDRRAHVRLQIGADDDEPAVSLDLPQLGIDVSIPWTTVKEETRRCRTAWEAYDAAPSPETFRAIGAEGDASRLTKIALGETSRLLQEEAPSSVIVRVDARLPVGAGFGSSAAVAVAVTAGYAALRGRRLDPDALHALSLDVERRQHGRPSGADNAAAIHGGVLRISRQDDALHAEPLEVSQNKLFDLVRIYHTGTPAESTGEVVAAVRGRVEAEPRRFARILDRMEEQTEAMRRELLAQAPDVRRAIEIVRSFEACLEELGVVPPGVREAIREVERRGGGAKISGAGSLSDPGAGALLVLHERPEELADIEGLRRFERLDLRLGGPGYREDSALPR